MNIYEILAERFTEGTEKYNTIYAAIMAGIADGTISERDVLKSPDSVINNLIRTIYSIKGDVVTGMVLVNGVTYEGDGKRYAELDSGSSGGGSGTDTTALIELLNNSINTTTNALSGQIEGLRTETNNTFKDTINLSDMPSYHILKGDISFSNETIVTGYEPLTWAGQATSKTIPITIDMVSQHGVTPNETYGGLILTRTVNNASSLWLVDSVRKFRTYLTTTATNAGVPNDGLFTSITPTALTIPSLPNLNYTGESQVMYTLGTTHRKSATDGSVELSVNGDFSNGTTGWINNGLLTMTVTNGRMVCTDNSTTSGWFYQDIPTTIGKLYTVKAELISSTGGDVYIGIGTTSDVYDSNSYVSITNGFGASTFKAVATTTRIAVLKGVNGVTAFTIDNISIKENTNPTNHNRWWECHYNPFTGLVIVNFEGSGLPKHEIRHFLGRELDFTMIKSNTHVGAWRSQFKTSTTAPYNNFVYINTTAAMAVPSGNTDTGWEYTKDALYIDKYDEVNQNKYMYSMYGFANSYKDESGKTIGAFEIGEYVPGQDNYRTEVELRGDPGLIMIKRLDDVGPWLVMDGVTRGKFNKAFKLNDNTVDQQVAIGAGESKFVITGTDPVYRTYGGRYAYLVIYNTEAAPDSKFKYKKTTTTTNVNISDVIAPIGSGIGSRGALVSTASKNSTLTGLTYTPGENYLFIDKTSTITTSKIAPKFLFNIDTSVNLGGFERDYEYDIVKQKWIKVVLSDVNESIKKDTLDFFGDGSCKALFRCNGDITELSGVYPPVNTNIGFVPGKFGQAAMFSAKESVMGLSATPLPITSRVVSVSNWIFGENPNYYMGFGRRTGNTAYNGNQWFRILGGSFGCGLSQVGDYAMYNFTLGKTGWNHYVTVLDGTYITIYVNGIKEFEYVMSPDVITNLNNFSGMYGILEESTGINGVDNKRLTIDQIRVFNRALTPAEVFKLFACYSYTYTDSNNTFLDHSVITNGDNVVTGIKKYPKTQYVDKLVVSELQVNKTLNTGPIKLEFLGGNNAMSQPGLNPKRIANMDYYNTSGKTRYVMISALNNAAVNYYTWFYLNGIIVSEMVNSSASDDVQSFCIPVPNGCKYRVSGNAATPILRAWYELEI